MKTIFLNIIALALALSPTVSYTQEDLTTDVLNNIYIKTKITQRHPVPYQFVREADVMWAQTVWRLIDLNQKINLKLYFPERMMKADERYSLIDLLMFGISDKGLKAYDPDDEFDEFKTELTYEEIKTRFGGENQIIQIEDSNGNLVDKKIEGEVVTTEVKEIMIKEEWFFDKQRSVLDVRIIAICPIRHFYKQEDVDQTDVQLKKLYWINFLEARNIFANHKVFNPYNSADNWSFDDVFSQRFFDSRIVKISNTYNNRRIAEYTTGKATLLEAERIKTNITNLEMDLWEY